MRQTILKNLAASQNVKKPYNMLGIGEDGG